MPNSILDLQAVVLRCPYANWHIPEVQTMFSRVIALKISGYTKRHSFGVMPIDGTDFVADHLLVCRRNEAGELIPVMGVKTLDADLCRPFHIEFTIQSFLKRGGHSAHLEALHEIMERARFLNHKIAYYSSWTIAPDAQQDPETTQVLKEMFAAMTVLYHREAGIPQLLGLGVPKFKTDRFFHRWGFERVGLAGQPLDNIPFLILAGIDGVFIHLEHYSDYAIECAEKFLGFWSERLVLGTKPVFQVGEEYIPEANL